MTNRVVKILMDRDGVSKSEAIAMVNECRAELYDALNGTSCLDPEEVLAEELGLEPDYIFDII